MNELSRSRAELEAECSRLRDRIQEYETILGELAGPRSSIPPASLKQLIELVPVGIAVLTPSLQWLAVNRYVCEITGIGSATASTATPHATARPQGRPLHRVRGFSIAILPGS